jgi:hypothetical protein
MANGNNEQYGAVRVLGEHGNTLKKPGRNQLACPAQMLTLEQFNFSCSLSACCGFG